MIEYAIRDCAAEAVKAQVTPDSAGPAPLWAPAWRGRRCPAPCFRLRERVRFAGQRGEGGGDLGERGAYVDVALPVSPVPSVCPA